MSVLEQKHEIERQINDLFRDVMSMSNDAFQAGASVQDLLDMKNILTAVFENAMQIRRNAKEFNTTQSNVRHHQINIGNKSTLQALFHNIKFKFTLLRDIFLLCLQRNNQTLNHSQVDEIQHFLNSRSITILLRDAPPLLPQVGSPVRRARSPSVARHHSSIIMSPNTAANASQVVSPENVIVNNHHSPNEQPGCFGKMCRSIKSRFSRNSRVHPHTNVGGKRKLRRRTHRRRRSRLH